MAQPAVSRDVLGATTAAGSFVRATRTLLETTHRGPSTSVDPPCIAAASSDAGRVVIP